MIFAMHQDGTRTRYFEFTKCPLYRVQFSYQTLFKTLAASILFFSKKNILIICFFIELVKVVFTQGLSLGLTYLLGGISYMTSTRSLIPKTAFSSPHRQKSSVYTSGSCKKISCSFKQTHKPFQFA